MTPRDRWPSLAAGIYGIIDTAFTSDPAGFARALVAGGIRVLQLRAKEGVDRERLRELVDCAHAADALVIVNDDVAAAELADGVHLGQEDAAVLDLAAVRSRLSEKVLGLSCGTAEEAVSAQRVGADYVGVGPMFATASKTDAGPPIGAEGVARVVRACTIPVVAIGGIDQGRLAEVRKSGAAMAAMISALTRGNDVAATAAALVRAWTALC